MNRLVALMMCAVSLLVEAQTTFNVDMSCEPDFEHVFVTGPWCGWCASDESNILTDEDGDGVYTISITNLTGTVEYKYAIDSWDGQENLVNDMQDGADCAPITDYNAYANRTVLAGGNTNDFYGTCDGVCNDVPPTEVTFHVDMSGYEGDQDPTQPTWNSEANGWCGSCAPMTDEDGNGVYSLTVPLDGAPGDTVEYKFAIGAWLDQEDIEPESSCTVTNYNESAPNGCCYVNRFVVLNGETIDTDAVCWNQCGSCITPGCTNPGACNYDPEAVTSDGSCLFPLDPCDDSDPLTIDDMYNADCACIGVVPPSGCLNPSACNFDLDALVDDGSCLIVGEPCDDGDDMTTNDLVNADCTCVGEPVGMGCTDPSACNFDLDALVDDGSCAWTGCGCTDPLACNFDSVAAVDDGTCCTCVELGQLPPLYRTWKFSTEAGAIQVGPVPGSGEWYASSENDIVASTLNDDRWSLYPNGTFVYQNNGSTQNPFEGYVETIMDVDPTIFELQIGGGLNGAPTFTVAPMQTSCCELCGWMGTWDTGPVYHIIELTDNRLVVASQQQTGDCNLAEPGAWFTFVFVPDGEPLIDTPVDSGWCISGCLDMTACNYSPYAEYDSGNCDYSCIGCTDSMALNYNPASTIDDGSCFTFACSDIGNSIWSDSIPAGMFRPTSETWMVGVEDSSGWVANLPSLLLEPNSSQWFATSAWLDIEVSGLPPGLFLQDSSFSLSSGTQQCLTVYGIPEQEGIFEVEMQGEMVLTVFGSPFSVDSFSTITEVEVLFNPIPIYGCTYSNALNYLVYATRDNGSCEYAGCTNPAALNFADVFTNDDGSCIFEIAPTSCPSDLNGDGVVGSPDLLTFLGAFGADCNEN